LVQPRHVAKRGNGRSELANRHCTRPHCLTFRCLHWGKKSGSVFQNNSEYIAGTALSCDTRYHELVQVQQAIDTIQCATKCAMDPANNIPHLCYFLV
jgi:hypothetical protein